MRNLIPAAILLLTVSCTYSPEDDVLTNLDRPETPVDVFISLNNYDEGTEIHLAEPTEFSYNIESDAGQLEMVEVLMNTNVIYFNRLPSGKFIIDASDYSNGWHRLRVQFRNRSGTGSLAETLGGERFTVWREWNVYIQRGAPHKPTVSFTKEGGRLKVSWMPYKFSNFENYTVTSQLPNGETKVTVITDPEQNYVIDDGYVGGYTIQYSVAIKTKAYFTQGDFYPYTSNKVTLTAAFNLADSVVTVKWRKPMFEDAFSQYVLTENDKVRSTVDVVSDTTATFKADVLFGKSLSYTVEVRAKNNFSVFSDVYELKELFPKLPLTPISLYYNKATNSIISWSHQTTWGVLTVFDENFVEQSRTICNYIGGHSVSYNSPYVYYVEYQGKRIIQKNIETNEITYVDINKDLGVFSDVSLMGVSSVSEDQLMTISYYIIEGNKMVNYLAIYDPVNRMVKYQSQHDGSNRYISPHGKYISKSLKMYRIDGSSHVYLYDISGTLEFNKDNDEEYMQLSNFTRMVRFHATSDGSLIKSYNYPPGCKRAVHDPATKSILFTGDGLSEVYRMNVETGIVTQVIGAHMDNASELDFINGFMIDNDNYYGKGWN